MSHFSVLVVLNEHTEDALKKALQPFHEYECTGIDDEYVIDVDVTDEVMKEWASPTGAVRLSTGELISRYDDRFYLPKTDGSKRYDGTPEKEFVLPQGAELVEVPRSELETDSLPVWALDYGGWRQKADGRFFRHTNPNKEWDWWVVGGRWPNKLLTLEGERGDSARKDELDLEGMRFANCATRRKSVEEIYFKLREKLGLTNEEITSLWNEMRLLYLELLPQWEKESGRKRLWDWLPETSPRFDELNKMEVGEITWGWDSPEVPTSESDPFEWAAKAPPLSAFAVLTEKGEWVEKGSMGWFGMVHGEREPADWESQFAQLFEQVRPEQYIVIVDCHI